MKKTTIATNRLITWLKGLIKEDKVDLQKNYESIMRLFDESNFIKTSPQERIALLKRVTASARYRLDMELEEAKSINKAIAEFKKEPYVYVEKPMEKRNYDFLAMHNIEFLRDVKN